MKIKITQGQGIPRKLRKLVRLLNERKKPHRRAGEVTEIFQKRHILDSRSPDGTPFKPISKTTIRKGTPGSPPLLQSRRLMKSIQFSLHFSGTPLSKSRTTTTLVTPGSPRGRRSIKAMVHQFGAKRTGPKRRTFIGAARNKDRGLKSRRIPPRPYLGLSRRNINVIQQIFTDFVRQQLKIATSSRGL